MNNMTLFWNQVRWGHLQQAFIRRFEMKEYQGYALAAAIAYTQHLCELALDSVADKTRRQ